MNTTCSQFLLKFSQLCVIENKIFERHEIVTIKIYTYIHAFLTALATALVVVPLLLLPKQVVVP